MCGANLTKHGELAARSSRLHNSDPDETAEECRTQGTQKGDTTTSNIHFPQFYSRLFLCRLDPTSRQDIDFVNQKKWQFPNNAKTAQVRTAQWI